MGEEGANQMDFLDSLVVSVFPASGGIATHQSAPQCQAHHGDLSFSAFCALLLLSFLKHLL